jgi:hypothetical protein
MSFISKYREEMSARGRPPSGAGTVIFAIGVVAAAVLGFLAAQTYWDRPGLAGIVADSTERLGQRVVSAHDAPSKGYGKRIGRAEVAPVFQTCADTLDFLQQPGMQADPRIAHLLLRWGNQPENYVISMGPFIDCALNRNRQDLCDPDNRALVVESLGRYLRFDDQVAKAPAPQPRLRGIPGYSPAQRENILLALAQHAREGRLVLSDFGWAPHAEIRKAFAATKPAADPCRP